MSKLATTEEIIEEARAGRMYILVDDEDRENEGDLIIPADACTDQSINFMAKYGRGLICLAMAEDMIEALGLSLMSRQNLSRHQTAFTVSIEAREGVTTGISAQDRAHTIATAVADGVRPSDIVSPGHVFPLIAREGGTLIRAGHTEAAVDISKLAGRKSAGVICEIMKDDGSMARLPDLLEFAKEHDLKVGTIADLIAYRHRTESLIQRLAETDFDSRFGQFKMIVYSNTVEYAEHIALVKGDVSGENIVSVRMHAHNILDDVLHDKSAKSEGILERSMRYIEEKGVGAVVLMREPVADSLSQMVKKRFLSENNVKRSPELREYGVGAQILSDLGIKRMELLSNSAHNVVGLDGYGLEICSHKSI